MRWSARIKQGTIMFSLLGLMTLLPGHIQASLLTTHYSLLTTPSTDLTVTAQAANPHFPDTVDFTLKASGFNAARATLNYSLVGEAVTAGVEANIKQATSSLDLDVTLDLATHYIPPGSEVAYYWTLTGPKGEIAETLAKTFKMLDDGYRWSTLTDPTGHVSVHWYDGSQEFGQHLLDTATAALDRLENDIHAGLARPADIWVYATQDELISALPQNIPEWVGGKAFPPISLVLAAIADNPDADSEIKRVVPHELSHLVLYQATRNPYNAPPAWLDEGLAVHNQQWQDPTEDATLQQAAEAGTLLPIKALSGSFGADEQSALLSYAESRSVIDFIVSDSRFGPAKFAKTVAAFQEGVTYDDALKAGLGVTVDELDTLWRASLSYKVAPQTNAPRPNPNQSQTPAQTNTSWSTPFTLVTLSAFLLLFIVGGILALIFAIRGARRET